MRIDALAVAIALLTATFSTCPVAPYTNDPLRSALRDLGYVEGRNIVIECRGPAGQDDRLDDLAAELARLIGRSSTSERRRSPLHSNVQNSAQRVRLGVSGPEEVLS